ncbi:hypothetical protein BH20ACT5_BH20ACT5_02640 [soil metagenome]
MIVVHAFARCRPDKRDTLVAALRAAQQPTRAEDGCLEYQFFASIDDDTSFVAVERWRDLAALQAHLQTPHIADLIGVLSDTLVEPFSIEAYDATPVELS